MQAGYEILKYISISIPFLILTQTSTAILQGLGNYMKPVYNLAMGCIVKVILTYVLVSFSSFNIYGAVIGTIFGYIVSCLLNMKARKESFKYKIPYGGCIYKTCYCSWDNDNCCCI